MNKLILTLSAILLVAAAHAGEYQGAFVEGDGDAATLEAINARHTGTPAAK